MKQYAAQPETDAQLQEAEHIAGLVIRFMHHALDDWQQKQLECWAGRKDNILFFEEITDTHRLQKDLELLEGKNTSSALKKCMKMISFSK